MSKLNLLKYINKLDAHHRLYISIAIAILVALLTSQFVITQHLMMIWVSYSVSYLFLAWLSILSSHPKEIRKTASLQDTSALLIFIFVLTAAVVSLVVVILLLQTAKNLEGQELIIYSLLSLASVILAWWTVHTVFTFRYAHLYYEGVQKSDGKHPFKGGLEFPKEPEPDYLDFVYFSFVVGMTFQVSDVEISSRTIRRLALMHGIISFIFNTIIVALTINIISSLIQK